MSQALRASKWILWNALLQSPGGFDRRGLILLLQHSFTLQRRRRRRTPSNPAAHKSDIAPGAGMTTKSMKRPPPAYTIVLSPVFTSRTCAPALLVQRMLPLPSCHTPRAPDAV